MKRMLTDIELGEDFTSFFFVPESPQIRQNKKNKDYLCLKLQDKSGSYDGRVWEYPPGFAPSLIKKGSYIKVRGTLSEWNETKQIAISQIRLVDESDGLDIGDFFERSDRDPSEMFDDLVKIVSDNVSDNYLFLLVQRLMTNNRDNLLLAPAAKSTHHAYIGGLLEHVLSMARVAVPISEHYGISKSLVVSACVLHDIGKLFELTYPVGIGYSVEGTLLGHISIGLDMVARECDSIPAFPKNIKLAILHMIASHHNLLQYGSPKQPLMREALVFCLIDMMDARNAICDRAFKLGIDSEGMTAWVKEMEGPLWKGPWEE